MAYKYNIFTDELDLVNGYSTVHIDANSYFIKNGNCVELWVNRVLSASWCEDAIPSTIGTPMGMLLSLTYPIEV